LDPSTNLCDVLNLDSIYQGRRVIHRTGTSCAYEATEKDLVETNLAPSECAMRMLLDDALLTPVALTTTDILAQIIFDTGASLTISPFRSDFVSYPTPLARPTQLGGMGKGLQIEVFATVAWTFTAKDKSEIQLRVRAYYVPTAKARLLSPQKIFDKKRCVFGHFHGDEDKFTLQVGNCPKVEVPYCPTSGLPIGESLYGPQVEPTVNISVMDEEKINLSPGKNLLIE
jgi:hypothetical protein